jgi:hypothetical protein
MAKTHVWVGGWVGGGGGVRGRGEEVPLCLITSLPEKKKKSVCLKIKYMALVCTEW